MEHQLVEFASNHALLVAAFFAILAMLAWNLITDPGAKGSVDPVGATELINHQDAVILDVRPMADFQKGHIVNAINIPMNGLKKQLQQLERYKDRPIVVSCRSGAQSSVAVKLLKKHGFERAVNLRGGILAWQNANLPVTRR